MRHRYRGFAILNMSTPRVRQLFVYLILGSAVIFVLTGLFAMIQAKRSTDSPKLGRITSQISTETLLYLMGGEVPHLVTTVKAAEDPGFSRLFFELATSVDPKDPRTFLGSELPGFALFDTEIVVAGEGVDYTSVPIESPPPSDLQKKMAEGRKEKKQPREKKSASTPASKGKNKVFIYHTHFTESYLPELKETDHPSRAYDNEINITRVGARLGKELEELGIGARVYTGGFDADWNRLYQASREVLATAIQQNNDLEYFIDIHRDSQRRDKTTKKISGKNYARIAFVVGTAHPHWEKNEQLARKLHKKLDELYPGLSKGVFRKSRAMGNGEYNQSLSTNSMLVEIGGVDNTFEESYRTTEALARALAEIHFQAVPVDKKAESNDLQ
ncbi:stage II sporulation protein P [Melghirimyces profundicolus]|uniref:Stage II sporulation protein P n=1 Tax=Melghirimyces profundicolus TaxID=1242148 RepID=A0A2T6C952_9BACL|nr:stage II sporulation protein P [Melghirimyces profundicolus]PTX64839.1 stage II sporulation protein P [Melghirimyces profundicolus]